MRVRVGLALVAGAAALVAGCAGVRPLHSPTTDIGTYGAADRAPAAVQHTMSAVKREPVLTHVAQSVCLSWYFQAGQPWQCKKWVKQGADLGIAGTAVYAPKGAGWSLIPYVYNPATNIATYDYRIDTSLQRPAFKSAGSANAYAFDALQANGVSVKNPQLHWPVCTAFTAYTVDYHGIAGTKLNKAVETARWKKAFAMITAVVPWERFRDLSSASTIYHPNAKAGAFKDGQIHITYGAKSGAYKSNFVTQELGYGGLHWTMSHTDSGTNVFNRIEWGSIIIDATKAANLTLYPSPGRAPGVDEVLNVYVHEIGHALGLQHTNDKYQIMYPVLQPQKPNSLGAGDKAALRKLFPAVPCPTHAS